MKFGLTKAAVILEEILYEEIKINPNNKNLRRKISNIIKNKSFYLASHEYIVIYNNNK